MKKQQISRWIVIALIVILIGTIIYLTKPQGLPTGYAIKKGERPIRINSPTWVGFAPFYLAEEKGFFEKEGVKVELIRTEESYKERLLLKTGKIDAQLITADMLVVYRDMGLPLVAVLELDKSLGGDGIIATSNIKNVNDLKGKTIALQKGTVSHFFLLYLLNEKNLTSKDVKILDMNGGEAGAAFMAGKVDAAVTWEPWLSKADGREGGHVLISSGDRPGIIVDVLAIRSEFIKERPEDVKSIMRAWFDAVEYWKTHRAESNEIMARAYNLPVEDFEAMISGLEWPGYNANKEYFARTKENPNEIYDIIDMAEKIYLDEGIITTKENPDNMINASFLEELYT